MGPGSDMSTHSERDASRLNHSPGSAPRGSGIARPSPQPETAWSVRRDAYRENERRGFARLSALRGLAVAVLLLAIIALWADYLMIGDRIPLLREGPESGAGVVQPHDDEDEDEAAEQQRVQYVPLPTPAISWFEPRPADRTGEQGDSEEVSEVAEAPEEPAQQDMPFTPGVEDVEAEPDVEPQFERVEPAVGNIGLPFRSYWRQNGGLMVFGYPLTVAFENDDGRTVQYFERQRFETHPENEDTAYDVLLGHLGRDDAARRGLHVTHPFRPQSQFGTPPGDDCEFFPETGHWVCDEFLEHWESNGLNLGDAQISFRESLGLFGYPISEVFTDPDSGLKTQYFERAKFEHHPDNDEEFQVLLGRLGAYIVDDAHAR
jgi:hypothetical protein